MQTRPSPRGASPIAAAKPQAGTTAGYDTGCEDAIVRALAYADIFDFALTAREIHRYLDTKATLTGVQGALSSAVSTGRVAFNGGVFTLPGRSALAAVRCDRALASAALWPHALRYGRVLGMLPFVRMVAVSGALAVDNIAGEADVDFLIVTEPGRLWMARGLTIGVVRFAARQGVELCPNYLLSERALLLDERDLFTAHELAQMVPLHGLDVYERMRGLNDWVGGFLPNAAGLPRAVPLRASRTAPVVRRAGEVVLRTRLGTWIERWESARKISRLSADPADGEVRFTPDVCKGHFGGYRHRILEQYEAQLATMNVPALAGEKPAT